jgi:chromosome segregation ATPase
MANSNLESEKIQLLTEIQESKISIESLANTLMELKSQLETQQNNCMSLEADKGKLLCEITDSKTLVASLENKLMEFKTVSEEIAEKDNVLQDTMFQIEHLKRELAEWSEKVAAMEKEDATSKEQILHLTSQMETWMQKYETAMFDLETSKSQLDAKDHEMAQLCQNLTADREPSFDSERAQKLEAELEEKKMTISGFEQALLQAQEYMDEKDVAVAQKTDEIKRLRSQMDEVFRILLFILDGTFSCEDSVY